MKWLELVRRRIAATLIASLVVSGLVAPSGGAADELDIIDLMGRLEKAYSGLVDSIMLFPVRESLDEPPFDRVRNQAAEVIEVALLLPRLENYVKDQSFQSFARGLEKQARQLQAIAKKERPKASGPALTNLLAACLRCHKEHRF